MSVYQFADINVAGEFPYKLIGLVSLVAFVIAYASKANRQTALAIGILSGFVFLAALPKASTPMAQGILDYNANLAPE